MMVRERRDGALALSDLRPLLNQPPRKLGGGYFYCFLSQDGRDKMPLRLHVKGVAPPPHPPKAVHPGRRVYRCAFLCQAGEDGAWGGGQGAGSTAGIARE
jgi:hypothetical protein